VIPCYSCGVVLDPTQVPNYDAKTGRHGKNCPVCHVPLSADAAAQVAISEGEEHGRDEIAKTVLSRALVWGSDSPEAAAEAQGPDPDPNASPGAPETA